ncbi:MAG: MATE family efflux transporter [Oligoflexia bacterium]|nr:MATE family efflux transporter [Oligoflexia bacterium]
MSVRSSTSCTALPERIGLREVHHLAWPVMISMLSQTAMSVADTLFVARLGTAPLAGIGLGSVASFVVLSAGFGLTAGLRVLVAQATGAARHIQARRLAWQGLWIALVLGVVGLLAAPLAGPLAHAFGASHDVTDFGADYLAVRVGGSGAALTGMALGAWFQGRGDTRTPMVTTVLANVLNIALDPVFIFGAGPIPALGVSGAALTTVFSQAIGALLLLVAALPHLRGISWAPDRALLRRAVGIGGPMALQGAMSVVGFAVFVGILARSGDANLGAHVIVMRIISLSFLPGHAVGQAAGVLVGQALGARRPALARQATRQAMRLAMLIMSIMGLVFVLFPGPLVQVFDPAADVAAVAVRLFVIAAIFQVFDAVAMVGQGSLDGAGDTRFTMVLGIVSTWLVTVPLGWLFALHFELGAAGAWLGLTAESVLYAGVALRRLRGRAWLDRGLERAEAEEAAEGAAEAAAEVEAEASLIVGLPA